jgi:NAD(P)H dehydrogenase (quinone)
MYAPAKDASVPIIEDPTQLEEFDGVLFGIPTRYGKPLPPTHPIP